MNRDGHAGGWQALTDWQELARILVASGVKPRVARVMVRRLNATEAVQLLANHEVPPTLLLRADLVEFALWMRRALIVQAVVIVGSIVTLIKLLP